MSEFGTVEMVVYVGSSLLTLGGLVYGTLDANRAAKISHGFDVKAIGPISYYIKRTRK